MKYTSGGDLLPWSTGLYKRLTVPHPDIDEYDHPPVYQQDCRGASSQSYLYFHDTDKKWYLSRDTDTVFEKALRVCSKRRSNRKKFKIVLR